MRAARRLVFSSALTLLAACSLTTSFSGLSDGANDGGARSGEAGETGSGTSDAADGTTPNDVSDASDPLAEGLVGFWRFEETANTVAEDSSGHGNAGTLMNGATRVPGKIGRAVSLDGIDDHVLVPANASLATSNEMSAAFWVYLTALATGSSPRLMTKASSWDIKLNGGYLQLSSSAGYAISTHKLLPGAWHHVTVVFDRGAVRVYLDGVAGALSTNMFSGGATLIAGDELYLGAFSSGNDFSNAVLDEVRLYGRALTAAEAATLAE